MNFTYTIISTIIISLSSFVGALTLAIKKQYLSKILLILVSLSAGTMLGGAFIHLLPEALENLDPEIVFILVLVSFCIFFVIENFLYWRHCHKQECKQHPFGIMNLIGNAIHNFTDGLIISSAFLLDINLGITTAIAIALHEIPQEISDFGVLIHSGFEKKKALILNFLVASTVILGGLSGFFLSSKIHDLTDYMVPFAAGGFIYISASDLIPEIRTERELKKILWNFCVFLLGLLLMYFL
ncbi:ZIP family metal transporter [Candidatus Dojkabacteria bacterium]|nr:ZIP family metal transporter [Candidatus Dojkabacteria bacterium]